MRPVEERIPLVSCPACAWARGGLSLLGEPMLVSAHLHRLLSEHLAATHGFELEAARALATRRLAPPEPTPTPDTERQTA